MRCSRIRALYAHAIDKRYRFLSFGDACLLLGHERPAADGLAAADRAGHDLEVAKQQADEQLAEAKREAAGIIEAANKRAQAVVEEAKDAASAEADRVKAAAAAEIEQERARAQEQLMTQVSALALAGAEKILAAEIDAGKHADLLKSLAAES